MKASKKSIGLLATDEAREEQSFLGVWIKRTYLARLTRRSSDRSRKSGSGQFPKTPLGFRYFLGVTRIELKSAVARVIHHNLGRHGKAPAMPRPLTHSRKLCAVRAVPVGDRIFEMYGMT
jgi:hypothetical protein